MLAGPGLCVQHIPPGPGSARSCLAPYGLTSIPLGVMMPPCCGAKQLVSPVRAMLESW